MNRQNVIVVFGERQWTLRATHFASAMARSQSGQVILVKMVPVRHSFVPGLREGYLALTNAEKRTFAELVATAEAYGVHLAQAFRQYASFREGLLEAAQLFGAMAVFVAFPASRIPFWSRLRVWRLRTGLAQKGQTLYTLSSAGDEPEWILSDIEESEPASGA